VSSSVPARGSVGAVSSLADVPLRHRLRGYLLACRGADALERFDLLALALLCDISDARLAELARSGVRGVPASASEAARDRRGGVADREADAGVALAGAVR